MQFLPHTSTIQVPLHDALSGPRVKGSHSIIWTLQLYRAFVECKEIMSLATLIAIPDPSAPLALVTYSSTSAMAVLLLKLVDNAWQSLAFFSKNVNPAQQKYIAYDLELLAVAVTFPSHAGSPQLHNI
jgi:hypothetical protein